MSERKIKRALISVYDKTGIVDFARALAGEFGIEIISTGGTAKLLKDSGIPVTLVEEVTGFPEMMDGRVKTLHPKIHAAILADRDNPEHMRQLEEQGIEPIDMVVANLYPFEKTVADPSCTVEEAIDMIDIGGPCLLRAAAKNHKHVIPVTYLRSYGYVLEELAGNGDLSVTGRMVLASMVYERTAQYDDHLDGYLTKRWTELRTAITPLGAEIEEMLSDSSVPKELIPERIEVAQTRVRAARYGENPHQAGALTRTVSGVRECSIPRAGKLSGEPSYNNYADAHAALELCKELTRELRVGPVGRGSVGPTFQSVMSPVTGEQHTERHLPHIQQPGAHYFVTFRLRSGSLSSSERTVVLEACKHWHRKKMTLHACVVMPDHVHILLTLHEITPGQWVPLGEIVKSIKGFSARRINKQRGTTGSIWLDESWDRIVRNEKEYGQRWDYIHANPITAGLGEDYEWTWLNHDAWRELAEYDRLESRSHTQARSPKEGSSPLPKPGSTPVSVFIKHTNACGVGVSGDLIEAYRRAYLGDPNAAMGGVLACNFDIDAEFARTVMETYARWGKEAGAGGFFVEVWVAPSFAEDAVEIVRTAKKWGERVRLLSVGDMEAALDETGLEYRSITGGMLVQTRDLVGLDEDQWKTVTKREPTEAEMTDLRLAWLVCKHTKSNAITICKDNMLIGNGAGQMSRVMSCRIATWLAKENGHADELAGAVAASDAFFPFRDGPDVLMDVGVRAIIQPGGSKRDADTIAACDERGVAMIFTGTRHFRH